MGLYPYRALRLVLEILARDECLAIGRTTRNIAQHVDWSHTRHGIAQNEQRKKDSSEAHGSVLIELPRTSPRFRRGHQFRQSNLQGYLFPLSVTSSTL